MSDDKEMLDVAYLNSNGASRSGMVSGCIEPYLDMNISYTKTSTANQNVVDALEEAWKLIRNNYGFESYSRAGEIFRALREKHKGS